MNAPHVLRVNSVEEEEHYRKAVSETISRIIAERGVTLIDIAERVDVQVKTISNAFNKKHSLSPTFLNRLGLVYGPHVLDPVSALSGGRMVPLDVSPTRDILPFVARANLKIAVARDKDSPGGNRELHTEKAGYLPDLRLLRKELDVLICQIEHEIGVAA